MKRVLLISLISIFASLNLLTESYEILHDNGTPKSIGSTSNKKDENGWLLGVWTDFSEDGEVTSRGTYKYKDELYKLYNENGQLLQEGRGIKGLAYGEWLYYHFNGTVKSKGMLRDQKEYGLWLGFYEDGTLYSESDWFEGERDGSFRTFHRNGSLCSNNLYEKGKLIGSAKRFYPNGQIEYEQAYVDGKPHGPGVRVDTEGKYLWLTKYENGKWIDKETRAKNEYLFREIPRYKPNCSRFLEPINDPQIELPWMNHGGCAVVDFIINEKGFTEDVKIRWSLPEPSKVFDNAYEKHAIKKVKKLEFPVPKDSKGRPSKIKSSYKLLYRAQRDKPGQVYPGCE